MIYIQGVPGINKDNIYPIYYSFAIIFVMILVTMKKDYINRSLFIGENGIVQITYRPFNPIKPLQGYEEIATATFNLKWNELISIEITKKSFNLLFNDLIIDPILLTTKQGNHKIISGIWEPKSNQQEKLAKIGILSPEKYNSSQIMDKIIKHYKPDIMVLGQSSLI